MRWMRRRGDRVRITTGKYAGQTGTVESNVYQRTVDYPDEWHNGHHIMLDTEVLVTVRWEQVEAVSVQCLPAAASWPISESITFLQLGRANSQKHQNS